MCSKFFNGDISGSLDLQLKLLPLINQLFCEVNPIPVKEAMNQSGLDVGECRMPLFPASDEVKEKIHSALVKANLL